MSSKTPKEENVIENHRLFYIFYNNNLLFQYQQILLKIDVFEF